MSLYMHTHQDLDIDVPHSRMYGRTPDDAVVAESTDTLNAKLDTYEVILSKQPYIGGSVRLPSPHAARYSRYST